MQKHLRDELIRLLDQACIDFLQTIRSAMPVEQNEDEALKIAIADSLATMRKLPNVRNLLENLESMPDSKYDEVRDSLTKGFPPYLRKGLLEVAKRLPPERGGRRRLLAGRERELCEAVLLLIQRGLGERDALRQMAPKYDVNLRTVQRTWMERTKWLAGFDGSKSVNNVITIDVQRDDDPSSK